MFVTTIPSFLPRLVRLLGDWPSVDLGRTDTPLSPQLVQVISLVISSMFLREWGDEAQWERERRAGAGRGGSAAAAAAAATATPARLPNPSRLVQMLGVLGISVGGGHPPQLQSNVSTTANRNLRMSARESAPGEVAPTGTGTGGGSGASVFALLELFTRLLFEQVPS